MRRIDYGQREALRRELAALDVARARWAMDVRAGRGSQVQITRSGNAFVAARVDTTRDARDATAGRPEMIGPSFSSEAEAQEFAEGALLGRRVFYFRGAPAVPIQGRQFQKVPIR